MEKDPAFLLYSKDFYEGTRMMLPEERACYIDLLVYQHQHGVIPNDVKRLVMYCSGCSEQTVKDVLNQKFNQTVNGWLNERLSKEVTKRSESKPKKTAAASFAGLISRSKLTQKQKEKIKKKFVMNDFILENGELITDESIIKSRVKEWFNHIVNQMVNNYKIENANANENIDIKNKKGEESKKTVNPEKVVSLYHQFCPNLPKVQKVSENRKKRIKTIISEYGLNKVIQVFQTAGESSFLNGGKGWKASFDWIMKTENFIKVLEGNYENKTNAKNEISEEPKINRQSIKTIVNNASGWGKTRHREVS